MQSNIFAKVAPLLKEKKLNIDCNAVLEFLEQHYKSGQWVYPDVLNTNLKISIVDAYIVMETCVDAGVAEQFNRYIVLYVKDLLVNIINLFLTFQTVLNVYIVIMR